MGSDRGFSCGAFGISKGPDIDFQGVVSLQSELVFGLLTKESGGARLLDMLSSSRPSVCWNNVAFVPFLR